MDGLAGFPLKRYPLAVSITFTQPAEFPLLWPIPIPAWPKNIKSQICGKPGLRIGILALGHNLAQRTLSTRSNCLLSNNFSNALRQILLCSAAFLKKLIGKIVPNKRPMDTVELGMKNPQEDEFAILNLGLESPYRYLAFPSLIYDEEFADEFWPKSQASRDIWAKKWRFFLKTIQYLNPNKRLVLKSPLHTARIEMILSVIPNAKFIHISRDPKSIIGSAQKTHEAMLSTHGPWNILRMLTETWVEDTIKSLEEMYQAPF